MTAHWHATLVIIIFLANATACLAVDIDTEWAGRSYWVDDVDELDEIPKNAVSIRMTRIAGGDVSLESFTRLRHAYIALRGGAESSDSIELPESIEVLQLGVYELFDAKAIEQLTSYPSLRKLSVYFGSGHEDALVALRELKHLEHIELKGRLYSTTSAHSGLLYKSPDFAAYERVLTAVSTISSLKEIHMNMDHVPAPGLLKIARSTQITQFASSTIDDGGLQVLCTNSDSLRVLNLQHNQTVTDFGLGFVHNLKTLDVLNLAGCRGVGDYSLAYISQCENLRVLDISANSNDIDDIVSGRYPAKRALEEKSILRVHRFHQKLELLSKLRKLRVLRMRGLPSLTPGLMSVLLPSLPQLEELDVSGCSYFPEGERAHPGGYAFSPHMDFSFFKKVESLRVLRLDRLSVSSWGEPARPSIATKELLEALHMLPSLEVLTIRGARGLPGDALNSLTKCRNLHTLDIESARFEGGLQLPKQLLGQLRELRTGYKVNEETVKHIAVHSDLKSLSIQQAGSMITSELLGTLKEMDSLEDLTIGVFRTGDDPDFEILLKNRNIRRLTIVAELEPTGVINPAPRAIDPETMRKAVHKLRPDIELVIINE